MIVKVKDKEYSFDGYLNIYNNVQKVAEECYEQGRADAIDTILKIIKSEQYYMDDMLGDAFLVVDVDLICETLEQMKGAEE